MKRSLNMLMTGCASGIGRHLAGMFAARGHRVVATDVDRESLEQAASTLHWSRENVVLRRLDVRSEAEWDGAIAETNSALGSIDVLLNIAGFLNPGYVADIQPGDIDRHLDVNVKGTILGT